MTPFSVNYSTSLYSSLIFSILIAILLVIAICKENKEFNNGNLLVSSTIWLVCFACIVSIMFCAIYTVFNFIFQDDKFKTVEYELKNGVIALRLSSILLIWNLINLSYKSDIKSKMGLKINFHLQKNNELSHICNLKDAYNSLGGIIVLQCFFYFQSLLVSWYFAINEIHDVLPNILNWLLLFILDDWIIISSYLVALDGFSINSHQTRITFFNILLFVIISFSAYKYFHWMFSIIYIPIILAILVSRYSVSHSRNDNKHLASSPDEA